MVERDEGRTPFGVLPFRNLGPGFWIRLFALGLLDALAVYGDRGLAEELFSDARDAARGARAFITAAGQTGPVPSPTYTLVEPYVLPRGNIYHIDLYRVADEEELRYLGWTELDDGCRLVEWPDRAPGLMAEADVELTLSYEGSGRSAELTGHSERGMAFVQQLASADSKD